MRHEPTAEAHALAERLANGGSLLHALTYISSSELLVAIGWQAVHSVFVLSVPVLVYFFLVWMREGDHPEHHGFLLAVAVPGAQSLAALARHRSSAASHRAGVKARTALITLTFLSAQQHTRGDGSDGDSQSAVGRFAELIGTGADAVQEFYVIAAVVLLFPFEIVGAIAILAYVVSYAALGALLLIAFVLMIQVRGGRQLEAAQILYDNEIADFSSELSEACRGALTIKLSGWTDHFLNCLSTSLMSSKLLGRKAATHLAALSPVTNTSVDMLSAVIALLYVFAMEEDLTPPRVAAYWIMLSILHARVLELPRAIKSVRVGRAAFGRFENLLMRGQPEAAGQLPDDSKESIAQKLTLAHAGDARETSTTDSRPLLTPLARHRASAAALATAVSAVWTRAIREINSRRRLDLDPTMWAPRCQAEVRVVGASFGYGETAILSNVDMHVKPGELACLHAPVGSGKTTLLMGLAGEATMANGTVKHIRHIDGVPLVDTSLPSVCAFVPQQPWLQSGTIRHNVIFDQQGDVDESRYRAVLRACCLDADIARMPAGDATEVGDGGSNLSGGQRQRVSLARAAYSAAPLVLLDDVLSALDPAVASEVFSRCILRLMAGRTRVLVTHSELIADHADAVYSLKDGAMARSEVGPDGGDTTAFAAQPDNDVIPTSTGLAEVLGHNDDGVGGNRGMRQFISQLAASVGGPRFFSCITVAFLLEMAVVEVGVLYLTEFAYRTEQNENPDAGFYLGIYVATVVFENVAATFRNYVEVEGCFQAHYRVLESLLHRIFHGDVAFLDRTTSAEVVHYFARDAENCTTITVKGVAEEAGYAVGYGTAVLIISTAVIPLFTPISIAIVALFIWLMRAMSPREALRDSTDHVAMFTLFSDMLIGLPTVRAAGAQLHIFTAFLGKLTEINHMAADAHRQVIALFLVVDLLGALFLGSLLLMLANERGNIDSGKAAFALLNATFGSGILHMLVVTKSEIDTILDAREKLGAAAVAPASINQPGKGRRDDSFDRGAAKDGEKVTESEEPSGGGAEVEFRDVTLRYDNGPAVVTEFSLRVQRGTRVGVVGRTGSGKSTLFRALTGLMTPASGSIELNGVDIRSFAEDDLRATVAMIPQHPHLFRGTLRYNIDPLGLLDDFTIWKALERAEYKDCVTSLDSPIESCGENLSAGESQLVCLARAFARGAEVILLDEATANLDDALMQRVELALSECAGKVTVIQIAHQTAAVTPCEVIIVMDSGRIIEVGEPSLLLEKSETAFSEMWRCDTRRRRSSYMNAVQPTVVSTAVAGAVPTTGGSSLVSTV